MTLISNSLGHSRLRALRALSAIAAVATLGLAGCAAGFGDEAIVAPFRDKAMSLQSAGSVVVAGTSTKADILAALGPATVIRFDSGYEVWAYRDKPARAAVPGNELVILFTPEGVVKKTRVRSANRASS